MHTLAGKKLLGDAEQGLWIALDEFEFRLSDWRLSPFSAPRRDPRQGSTRLSPAPSL